MSRDQKRTYSISALVCGLSLLLLFFPKTPNAWLVGGLLGASAVMIRCFIKKRHAFSINKYPVLLIVGVSAPLRITVHYLLGLHFGMAERSVNTEFLRMIEMAIPIVLIICATELIRVTLLVQRMPLTSAMAFVIGLSSDILLAGNLRGLDSMNAFMDMAGLVFLPAVVGNLLYHYLTRRYGILPSLAWRLIMALYPVFITHVTFTPDAITAFGGLVLPLLIYAFVDLLYERKRVTHRRARCLPYVGMGASLAVMLAVVMLISCQFQYGMLVIATPSMTGELNVGDAVVYEEYDGQVIDVGDVVVYRSGSVRVIHRVVNIVHVGHELLYVTQGDANDDPDFGYRTSEDIVGLVRVKVAYVGYPSIWLNEAFTKPSQNENPTP